MNSLAISKRSLAIAFIAAFAMAFILAMGMATPAHAAQKKPYAGYLEDDTYSIYDSQGNVVDNVNYTARFGAGSIVMENVGDTRKVKAGFLDDDYSFTVWSGSNYKDVKSAFNGNWTNPDGTRSVDSYTVVDNTSQFKKLKGMTYNKKKNTLTLKNVKAPAYNLKINGMGTGFKIVLKGKNQLAGIEVNAVKKAVFLKNYDSDGDLRTRTSGLGYYPCSVTIDGAGSLVINKKTYNNTAIIIKGGDDYTNYWWTGDGYDSKSLNAYTKSKLTITKKPKVQIYAYGASPTVRAYNSAAKKPVSISGLSSGALDGATEKISARSYYEWTDFRITQSENDMAYDTSTGEWGMKLNDGAFFGVHDQKSPWYVDTKTRQTYYSKWKIYRKVGTYDYDDYAVYVGTVGNNKDLPKGYNPVISSIDKTHYTYTVKNSKLVAGSA